MISPLQSKEDDASGTSGITTPSAPRARKTSDIGVDIGDGPSDATAATAATAAASYASYASFASFASFAYTFDTASSTIATFQASPAMLTADGLYLMESIRVDK